MFNLHRADKKIRPEFNPNWTAIVPAAGIIITFILEALSRQSLPGALLFMVQHFGIFLFNTLIITDCLAVCMFFRRRLFVFSLAAVLWLTCGVVNCMCVSFRTLPFTVIDISLLGDALKLFDVYFVLWQRILIIVLVILLIIGILVLAIKAPKSRRVKAKKSVTAAMVLALLTIGFTNLLFNTGVLTTSLYNLMTAYANYGFPYCFICTFLDVGITQPENYSRSTIREIQSENEAVGQTVDSMYGSQPNIIYIQLESFFDPKHVTSLGLTEDPVPTFTSLKQNYPSGYLTMPAVGGGTANSEFEMLTGMTLSHFGAGEYPYNTILQNQPVESICYDLKSLGYTCHAIHNNTGTFYNRNIVYSYLGFDTFTPLEYMNGYTTNSLGFARDSVLPGYIMSALRSTESSDLIFTVTVQSHGRYPTESTVDASDSLIDEFDNDNASYTGMDYYLQEVREVDSFIATLINSLSAFDEPTVVVFYGDHLPSLGLTDDDLNNGNLYETEYIIWNNYSGRLRRVADKDLYAYQLTGYVTDLLNIHEGNIYKLHQRYLSNSDISEWTYMENLQELEYDMLYGDQVVYKSTGSFERTDLQMGISSIAMTGMYVSDGALVVTGSGFTSFSELYYGDKQVPTIFVSPTILVATEVPEADTIVSVGQVTADHTTLSYANPLVMPAAN